MLRLLSLLALLTAMGCQSKERAATVKLSLYKAQGEALYIKHCSNCHQKDGQGLAQLYPPLAGSVYLRDSLDRVICIIRNGMSGEITINGRVFNQPMPGVPSLTDLEVAEIITFAGNSWGNEVGLVEVGVVAKSQNCPR